MSYKDFTSLSPSEEQAFVPYEQRMQEDSAKANKIAWTIAGIFGVIVTVIVLSLGSGHKAPGTEAAGEGAKTEEAAADK